MPTIIECRSDEGVTIGLIDSLNTISQIIATRDLTSEHVREALEDLYSDPSFNAIRMAALSAMEQ